MTADEMLQEKARPEAEYDRLAKIREIAPELDYTAVFVPQSQSRNAGDKNLSLNWRVTLRRKPTADELARWTSLTHRDILTTDYMQGIGHAPGYTHGRMTLDRDKYFHHVAEKGKTAKVSKNPELTGEWQWVKPLPPPELADVLHSLLLDAEAIDAGGFEEWAGDFGYEVDSREAERIYKACVEVGLKLRAALGDDKMTELREALQDM
jgi:hypothetical protein